MSYFNMAGNQPGVQPTTVGGAPIPRWVIPPSQLPPGGRLDPEFVGAFAYELTLDGSVTAQGAPVKMVSKNLSGTSATSGAPSKFVAKVLAGSSTATGTIAAVKLAMKSLTGSSTPSGTLLKTIFKQLVGSSAPTGTPSKLVAKTLGGSSAATGKPVKLVSKVLAGSSAATGTLRRALAKVLSGSSAAAGIPIKQAAKKLAGTSTPTGAATLLPTIVGGAVRALVRLLDWAGRQWLLRDRATTTIIVSSEAHARIVMRTRPAVDVTEQEQDRVLVRTQEV